MSRKSNYRTVAAMGLTPKLGYVTRSFHVRWGVLTAMIWLSGEARAQVSGPVQSPSSKPVHSVSPEIRQAVTEKLPKYTPPAPVKEPEVVTSEESDSSGNILRLPKVTVRANRAPVAPTEFALLTPKGKLEMAMKSNPGLKLGNLFGLNNGTALAIQAEEREVAKKEKLADEVRRANSDNSPESKKTNRLLKEALQRPNSDWLKGR